MDEKKQKPKANYQPSVEAGLRRLESEKLSFLGSGKLVSKFDPEDLETFARSDAKNREREVSGYDPTFQELGPHDTASAAVTLDQISESESILDDIMAQSQSHHDDSLNIQSTADLFRHAHQTAKMPAIPSKRPPSRRTDSEDGLIKLGKITASAENAPKVSIRPAATLDFAAIRDYDSHDSLPSQASDRGLPTQDDIQELTSQQFSISTSGSMEMVPQKSEELQNSPLTDENLPTMAFIASEKKPEIPVPPKALSEASEQFELEIAETVDIGKIAEQVRMALAKSEPQPSKPSSCVLKPGAVKLPKPQPQESSSAIDKLKQQGLFEHLGTHAEVSNSILSIQSLNDLLPPSEVISYPELNASTDTTAPNGALDEASKASANDPFEDDGEEDNTCKQSNESVAAIRNHLQSAKLSEQTAKTDAQNAPKSEQTSKEDTDVKEVREMVRKAKAAAAASKQANVVPTAHANEDDLDDRMTIPISIKDNADFAKMLSESEKLSAQETPTVLLQDNPSNTKAVITWIMTAIALCCGVLVVLHFIGVLPSSFDVFKDKSPVLSADHTEQNAPPSLEAIRASIDQTSTIIHKATHLESWLEPWIEQRLTQPISPENKLAYIQLARDVFPQHPIHTQRLVETYIAAGKYEEARSIVRHASPDIQSQTVISDLYYRSFAEDPHFIGPAITLNKSNCDMISPLGGGSTLTFKLLKDGKAIGAFKPLQTRRQSNYRSEVAAWRLCELLDCHFDIPWNRPVRIEHEIFNQLYNQSTSPKRDTYRKELVDIIWSKEENSRFVYGTLKDWVPNFTKFPIELTSMWKPWLSLENYMTEFPPLEEALQPINRRNNVKLLYPELIKQSPNLTTQQLAAQISEILVFDFLLGNWDRFSGVPSWWGANCQFKDGRIISIDNGAAFTTYSNDDVMKRFLMTERFNASFINALRNLDKTQTATLLFPNATEHELQKIEQLWKQRDAVLKRIDELSQKYGADKVLSL